MQESEDTDPRIGKTLKTNLEFGPPKYTASIPKSARRSAGLTDLEYEKGESIEKVVVEAELTITDIYTKNLGGEK